MITDRDLGTILDLIRPYLARQVADTVAESSRLGRIPTLQPATVIDTNTASGVIDVLPDGGGSVTVPAATLIGIPEFGARVMLLYEPPAGVFVVGYIGARRQPHISGGRWNRIAGQNVNPGAVTAVSFDSETFDSDGFVPASSNTFTVPATHSGRYLFTAAAGFNAAPGGRAFVQLVATGYGTPLRSSFDGSLGEALAGVSGMFNLAEGNTVQLQVYHVTLGVLAVTGYMEAVRLLD